MYCKPCMDGQRRLQGLHTYCEAHVDVVGMQVVALLDVLHDHVQARHHLRQHTLALQGLEERLEEGHRLLVLYRCLITYNWWGLQ